MATSRPRGRSSKPPAPATPTDGRHARTARTRAAILDAVLDLVRGGNINPTASEIATRAQVSLRSIGQHFPTRVELFAAAAARYQARPAPTLPAPTLALARRLDAFLDVRTRDLEASRPIRASAAQFAADFPVVAAAIAGNAARRQAELAQVFPAELAGLDPATAELLDVAVGGRMWDALRERGNSVERARSLVRRLVTTLLAV